MVGVFPRSSDVSLIVQNQVRSDDVASLKPKALLSVGWITNISTSWWLRCVGFKVGNLNLSFSI